MDKMDDLTLKNSSTNVWQESIGSILSSREMFINYPPFQREMVWTDPYKRRLIDTILHRWPIGMIVVAQATIALNGIHYEVLDGQQRLTTIIDFYLNKFKTQQRSWRNELGMAPIEPGKYFSEMSEETIRAFLTYKLTLMQIDTATWKELGCMYRRLQWANPLSTGEKLWSYQNREVVQYNEELSSHPFFTKIYIGRKNRKEQFQLLCTLIVLAGRGPYANVTSGNLHDAAYGAIKASHESFVQMTKRLDHVVKLFDGYQTTARMEIIPLIQSIYILETENCDFGASETGSLKNWWAKLQLNSKQIEGTPMRMVANWDKTINQAKFWIDNQSSMLMQPGLRFRDTRRKFSETMKLEAWLRQDGKCAICGKKLYLGQAVGHHATRWADGGSTTSDNCEAVHTDCHRKVQSMNRNDNQLELLSVK